MFESVACVRMNVKHALPAGPEANHFSQLLQTFFPPFHSILFLIYLNWAKLIYIFIILKVENCYTLLGLMVRLYIGIWNDGLYKGLFCINECRNVSSPCVVPPNSSLGFITNCMWIFPQRIQSTQTHKNELLVGGFFMFFIFITLYCLPYNFVNLNCGKWQRLSMTVFPIFLWSSSNVLRLASYISS